MTDVAKRKSDPRAAATRLALIEAAESLFARFGFEAVSMRQIGAAIGAGNTRVVAYHFGTKEEFIEAIYRHRLPAMDERRRELLREAAARGVDEDLAELVRILCLPLFEQTDRDGVHSYGRFLCEMVHQGRQPTALMLDDPFPATTQIWQRIRSSLPVEGDALAIRMRIFNQMTLEALRIIDGIGPHPALPPTNVFDDALQMAVAALTAPAA